jgi:hypothetical protein
VDGTFRVKGLPPGDYFVVAVASIDAGTSIDEAYLEQLAGVASRLAIARGEKRHVDLRSQVDERTERINDHQNGDRNTHDRIH